MPHFRDQVSEFSLHVLVVAHGSRISSLWLAQPTESFNAEVKHAGVNPSACTFHPRGCIASVQVMDTSYVVEELAKPCTTGQRDGCNRSEQYLMGGRIGWGCRDTATKTETGERTEKNEPDRRAGAVRTKRGTPRNRDRQNERYHQCC